jgi:hypothetical protein
MNALIRKKVMDAVPIGAENAKPAGEIADAAGLNRRSMGTRLNAISATQSKGDELGELYARQNHALGKTVWWRKGVKQKAEEAADSDGKWAEHSQPLEEIVKAFLGLVIKQPDKQPRLRRDQESNLWTVHGFNRGQETLRTLLDQYGATDEICALAEIREEGQQKPTLIGDRKLWLMS